MLNVVEENIRLADDISAINFALLILSIVPTLLVARQVPLWRADSLKNPDREDIPVTKEMDIDDIGKKGDATVDIEAVTESRSG